jgi:hypothetical protein
MQQDNSIEYRVEETMNSLDGLQKASPAPFFYTRLMARMEAEEKNLWENITSFITRPYVIASVISFIIVLNMTAVFRQADPQDLVEQSDISMVDEYKTASTSFYDYTNVEP